MPNCVGTKWRTWKVLNVGPYIKNRHISCLFVTAVSFETSVQTANTSNESEDTVYAVRDKCFPERATSP